MTANIPTLLEGLRHHLAQLGDGRDARSDNEKAAYWRDYNAIQRTISGLLNAPHDLDRRLAQLADLEARRTIVLEKQAELEHDIATAPDWQTSVTPASGTASTTASGISGVSCRGSTKARSSAHRARRIRVSLNLDARIAESTERRNRAQGVLDASIEAAHRLLAVESQEVTA